MSGMEERAKQFKEAAESKPSGDQLTKEIATLRRFLFRNQEYRFTKSGQSYLYMAVLAHYANPAAQQTSSGGDGEPPVLKLLDDALKMPFTVFSSSQKDRLLQLYWAVLGEVGEGKDVDHAKAPACRARNLTLLDVSSEGDSKSAVLSLMRDDGEEYTGRVVVPEAGIATALRVALESGASVVVSVKEAYDGSEAQYVGFVIDEE